MIKNYLLAGTLGLLLFSCHQNHTTEEKKSGAAQAMEEWALVRSYPQGRISVKHLTRAFEEKQLAATYRSFSSEWKALGPKNFGGRTLCLAFHPSDPDIIYAGSAGGGLWRSTTAGKGPEAWERVSTGHPVLGVGSIAIDPTDPDVMYIGTGEVYNYTIAAPGVYDRLTRGSYGIGLLKSSDGGASWEKSIDWSYGEMKGVWDVVINPENPNTVFAATTEGLYRSYDAGDSWALAHDFPMGVDIEMHPVDTNTLYLSHGGYLSPAAGIFRSVDGGSSFDLVSGLPDDFTGKALISISPSDPNVIYISIGDALSGRGLYRSDDGGQNWVVANATDVPTYQGWYSHDVGIKPNEPDNVLWAGVDVFKSVNSGSSINQVSNWWAWYLDQTPLGGPEGPPNYVHADIHAIYYSPFDPETVFLATDGGIFVSEDNGENWEGRNGSYQTQQFYANFSNSATNPNLAMGGLQDNATAIYRGDPAWDRVIGGDGMSTAIHPQNDDIMYGSYQRLNILRSFDEGQNFSGLNLSSADGELRNFSGPFELSPQSPNTMYAGGQRLHKSTNNGGSWTATSNSWVDASFGNPILTIAIAPSNTQYIMVSTSPLRAGSAGVFLSQDGGQSWEKLSGLPDRVAMDIVFHPEDEQTAYVVFSGFNTSHVFKTEDSGGSWLALDNGLPDVPTNTILIDPEQPDIIYVGNDLGVYASTDAGQSWEPLTTGLPGVAMAYHLSISPSNRKLRLATHGLGVYETGLLEPVSSQQEPLVAGVLLKQNFPNPVENTTRFSFVLPAAAQAELRLVDNTGRMLRQLQAGQFASGEHMVDAALGKLPAGVYAYVLEGRFTASRQAFREGRVLVKQ